MLERKWEQIANEVDEEIAISRDKYPNPALLATAMSVEAGEALQVILKGFSRGGFDTLDLAEVRRELVQVMAVCVRLIQEGDPVYYLPGEKR